MSKLRYFCVRCQEKNPVQDIGVDVWGIIGKELNDRLKTWISAQSTDGDSFWKQFQSRWTGGADNAEVADEEETVLTQAAKNKEARYRKAFALSARNADERLANAKHTGKAISGTYRVTVGDMLRIVPACTPDFFVGGMPSAGFTEASYYERIGSLPAETTKHVIFEKLVVLHLMDSGAADYLTDDRNFPFSDTETGVRKGYCRVCTNCGERLSRVTGAAEETVVAMTGSARAGKTSCMIALIASLLSNKNPLVTARVETDDPEWSWVKTEVDFYNRCIKVIKTDNVNQSVPPMVSVLLEAKHGGNFRRVLTMIDMPGEFWMTSAGLTEQFYHQYGRVFGHLDCIWLLVSKATITLANQEVDDETGKNLEDNSADKIEVIKETSADSLGRNLKALNDLYDKAGGKMPPILVIVTKPDHLIDKLACDANNKKYGLYPESGVPNKAEINKKELSKLLRSGGLSIHGFAAHAKRVRSFIKAEYEDFVREIERGCTNRDGSCCVSYISMSPYGRPALPRPQMKAENGNLSMKISLEKQTEGDDMASFEIPEGKNDGETAERILTMAMNVKPIPYHEQYPLIWTLALSGGLGVETPITYLAPRPILGGYKPAVEATEYTSFRYKRWRRDQIQFAKKQMNKEEDLDRLEKENFVATNLLMAGKNSVQGVTLYHAVRRKV